MAGGFDSYLFRQLYFNTLYKTIAYEQFYLLTPLSTRFGTQYFLDLSDDPLIESHCAIPSIYFQPTPLAFSAQRPPTTPLPQLHVKGAPSYLDITNLEERLTSFRVAGLFYKRVKPYG